MRIVRRKKRKPDPPNRSPFQAGVIPAYILCVDLAAWAIDTAYHCQRLGLSPVIVDHGTTYQPSLALLRASPYPVEWRGPNGPYYFWADTSRHLPARYVVTDCDLDLSGVPDDVVRELMGVLNRDCDVAKVGLSLEINDLPDTGIGRAAREHEAQFWVQRRADGHWDAALDTTFALYDSTRAAPPLYPAVRLDRPWTARHRPWYLTPDEIPPDMACYLRSVAGVGVTHWSRMLKASFADSTGIA